MPGICQQRVSELQTAAGGRGGRQHALLHVLGAELCLRDGAEAAGWEAMPVPVGRRLRPLGTVGSGPTRNGEKDPAGVK